VGFTENQKKEREISIEKEEYVFAEVEKVEYK
jgi:hypothetical protein